jgi:predicted RNase H-like nuclease (RuvC/YqgF family)
LRTCSTCRRTDRERIDAAIVTGTPLRAIARQFETSKDAVHRHSDHVVARVATAHEARETASATTLLAKAAELESKARHLLEKSEQRGQLGTSVAALRELRQIVELLARISGELESGVTVNLFASAEYGMLQRRMLQALEPFPEARTAVARALLPAGSSDV